jgi:RimJ/RimL family protein N-acetyltransferase
MRPHHAATLPNNTPTGKGDPMQPPDQPPTLTGDDVTLRIHRAEDENDVVAQCRDPLMQRWTVVPVPYNTRDAREWIDSRQAAWTSGREFTFAIEHGGRFAGSIDLRPRGHAGLDVGYGLAPWARGCGLTRRALRALLPWAFDTLGTEIVLWQSIAGNWASRRVAWSVGFRMEGTVRGLVEQRGLRLDGWIATLRRGDRLTPAHPWFTPPVLTGHKVRLRPHRHEDAAAMAHACDDPRTQFWLPNLPTPYTGDDALAHLEETAEEQAAGRALFWALADPESDQLIGEIGMWGLLRGEARSAEIGYWSHPTARGRGLMTEAIRLASAHALLPREKGGLGLAWLVIRAAEGNTASQHAALRAGFSPTGRDRRAELLRDGGVQDLLRYDLLAEEVP